MARFPKNYRQKPAEHQHKYDIYTQKIREYLAFKSIPPQLTNYIVSTINIEQKIYIGSIQFFLVGEVGLGPTFQ